MNARLSLYVCVAAVLIRVTLTHADGGVAQDADTELRAYYSANGLLDRGLYELAVAEYQSFLKNHADHEKAQTARYGLGVCFFRLGRHADAVSELDPLRDVSGFPYTAEVAAILGQCHAALGRFDKAAEAFKRVLDAQGDSELAAAAAAGRAESLLRAGRHQEAVVQCGQFVRRWPKSALRDRVEFFRAVADMETGGYAAAAGRFERLLDGATDSPFTVQARLLLAQCYDHTGMPEKAERGYRRLLEKPNAFTADALLGLAVVLLQQRHPGEAGELLDRFLTDYPAHPDISAARLHRARAWFEQDEAGRAAGLLRRVADSEDTPADLRDDAEYWLAKCLFKSGSFEQAAELLEHATGRFKDSEWLADMLYDRAVALVRVGNDADAAEAARSFRTRFPDHAMAAEALYLAALTAHHQKQFVKSEQHCDEFRSRFAQHQRSVDIEFLDAENKFLTQQYKDAADVYRRLLTRPLNDAQSLNARRRLGTCLYLLADYDEARSVLSKIASDRASARPVCYMLGDMAFQNKDWAQAVDALTEYLAAGGDPPDADDALLKLGLAHQRSGDHTKALDTYDRFLARYRDSPHTTQVRFERGQTLLAMGDRAKARRGFERLLNDEPDCRFTPYILNHLGSIAIQESRFERAAQFLGRAADDSALQADALLRQAHALFVSGDYPRVEETVDRFLSAHPSHPDAVRARALRALALSRRNRHEEALTAITTIERDDFERLDAPLRAALRYEKAWTLGVLDRADEAAKAFRDLLEQQPDSRFTMHALFELAGIESDAKRFDRAAKLLERFHDRIDQAGLMPGDPLLEQAGYQRAVCYYELGELEKASQAFSEFLNAHPKSDLCPTAEYLAADALMKSGKHRQAVDHLERVSAVHSTDDVHASALLKLGECNAVLQRWARSEEAFNTFLDRFEHNEMWFQARFGLGWARENQGRYKDAVDAYRDVTARHKGRTAARAQFQIGECLFAMNRFERAARELLKVDILYDYPEWSAAALYEAGRCLEELGRTIEARQQFDRVTGTYADTRWAHLARRRLETLSTAVVPGR